MDATCRDMRSDGDRAGALRTTFVKGALPLYAMCAFAMYVGAYSLTCAGMATAGWRTLFLILFLLNTLVGLYGIIRVSLSWNAIRKHAYPNIDATARETWDLAVWLAENPQFGGTPLRDVRQQALRDALDEYGPMFRDSMPEDVSPQLAQLERLMHDVDWTGQYVHALFLFRYLKDTHLARWRQLDDVYLRTVDCLLRGVRLDSMRLELRFSSHRMVVLNGLQINCRLHGTTGEYTVPYGDGGVM